MNFEKRKDYFKRLASDGSLCVDLAFDIRDGNRYVGYCVSSLSKENKGEIESIFVDEAYRSRGIGLALITRALGRLDENGSSRNRVSVSEGNEQVWKFYKKIRILSPYDSS